ncbi:MAG TPA: ATPase [Nitrolancea sp.]|nr:ATPase [Nitrolancea sp.]
MSDSRSSAQPTQVNDILHLIDRLEEVAASATRVPFGGRIVVDEGELLDIIDQLRLSIPQEIKQARSVVRERHQIIAEAQTEAERILSIAKERAEYLMSEQGLVNEARARGEEILRDARDKEKRSMGQVDLYALQILSQMEQVLERNLEQVSQSLEEVRQAKDTVAAPAARP